MVVDLYICLLIYEYEKIGYLLLTSFFYFYSK